MKKTVATMHLDGGCLCLNFTNTIHSRTETPISDYLNSYEDMIIFADRTKILSKKQQETLRRYAAKYPDKAAKAFKKIKRVREELFVLFAALAGDKKPSEQAISRFNKTWPEAFSHLAVHYRSGMMQLSWKEEQDSLLLPLWMCIKSAYDLLFEVSADRIKACPACLWLFVDKTKNNKRRWCNSLTCGSVDKASRYYHRKKQQRQ